MVLSKSSWRVHDHGHTHQTRRGAGPEDYRGVDSDDVVRVHSNVRYSKSNTTTNTVSMFRVEELECATEENELRDVFTPLNGVRRLDFDLVRPPGERHSTTALTGPDRSRQPQRRDTTLLIATPSESATRRLSLVRSTIVTTAVAGLLAGFEVCVVAGLDERSVPVAVLAVAAIALGGRETSRKGWQALRSRRLTMNLLMPVTAIGAMAIGRWPEAAVVICAGAFSFAEVIVSLLSTRS